MVQKRLYRSSETAQRRIARTVVSSILRENGRNRRGKGSRGFLASVASIIVVLLACLWTQIAPKSDSPQSSNVVASTSELGVSSSVAGVPIREDLPGSEGVLVERCVDGDTLIVNTASGTERVRLIGANTPETVKANTPIEPFGPEASAYTKQRVSEANNIAYLVSDGQKFDKYDRRLAFVYLGNDAVSLNEDLVRQGLARATLQYDFSREMKDRLANAQAVAQEEKRGIFSLTE